MPPKRLEGTVIAELLDGWPGELCDLALELRELVLDAAPEVEESIAFRSLSYAKPGMPYGVIGGNVCFISVKDDLLYLSFIHGAFLPDPDGLLKGRAKYKREIEIRRRKDIRRRAFRKLIRAAVAYDPTV